MKTTLFRFGITWVAAIAVGAAWLMTSCRKQEADLSMPTDAVALVGQGAITREAFQSTLARRAGPSFAGINSPQMKQELLAELIRFEVLYQRGLAAGYDQDPEIISNLKRMIATKFLEDQLEALGPTEVTAEEIAEYYRNNQGRFGTPEQVRVAIVEIKAPRSAVAEKRADYKQKAQTVLEEAQTTPAADGTFGLLAQLHSEDQVSRYRGGDLGWLTVGDTNAPWDPEILNAVFQLAEPGALAPVVETPAAFYLIKLIDRRSASMRPLEEVKDGIEYLVTRQKEAEQLATLHHSLQQGLMIRTNQALLDSIQPTTNETRPPDMPGVLSAEARTP